MLAPRAWGSLCFPFGVHLFGNLWWEVFNVSNTALGGWFAFGLQVAMILLAIAITRRMTPAMQRQHHRAIEARASRVDPMQLSMAS